ncbi:MAG: TPD domain-containing protein [Candidatus Helarchaeota archaeon]
MYAINYTKYCQGLIEKVKNNYWRVKKLSKLDFNKDIFYLVEKTKTTPIIVLRQKLKVLGYTNKQIKSIINLNLSMIPNKLKDEVLLAIYNDPVYSPIGIKYFDALGREGENIIKEWLESQNITFKRDPRNSKTGMPDFVLEKKIQIFKHEVKWIESKCTYGDFIAQKNNFKQFTRFDDFFGNYGCIVYWFGYEKNNKFKKRLILTWNEMLKLTPNFLHPRIKKLISEIPEEFEYLLIDIE